MKIITVLLFAILSFLFIPTAVNSENSLKNKSVIIIHDTLPVADTGSANNRIDTFGGIKNMNDTNLKAKKDSLFK